MRILTLMGDGIRSAAYFWSLGILISRQSPLMVVLSFRVCRGFRRSAYGSCQITGLAEYWKISLHPLSRRGMFYWRELSLAWMASLLDSENSGILIVRKR